MTRPGHKPDVRFHPTDTFMFQSARSRVWQAVTLVLIATLAVSTRHVVLGAIGRLLVAADPVERVELAVMTMESGGAGELELSELFREQVADRVAVLSAAPTAVERELERRGVQFHEGTAETLAQLGIPPTAIMTISAGEGGTTESVQALGGWCREHAVGKILVVVSAAHGRRYRRALRRAWGRTEPLPLVRVTRFDSFHATDWWRARTTRREGIIELQKLGLDFLSHPF